MIFAARRDKENPLQSLCGNFLGQLTDELKGEMRAFVTTGAKSYSYKEEEQSSLSSPPRISHKVKAKGFAMTGECERKINFELMQSQVDALLRGEDLPTVTVNYDCIRRDAKHQLLNVQMSKIFKFTFDKRIVLPDGGTLPFGYKCE